MKQSKVMTFLMLIGVIDAQETGFLSNQREDHASVKVGGLEQVHAKEAPSPIYCAAKTDGTVSCFELAHNHPVRTDADTI